MMSWEWSIDGWIVLVGLLSACSCALLGNYLVLRRLSLMGDAISHAVLPGLALAFILSESRSSWPMFAGAVVVGVLTALLTEVITRFGKVEHGAAMGVVFSVLFAIGLVLIRQAADHVDLDPGCVLYGNIVQVPIDAIVDTVPDVVVNLAIVLLLNIAFIAVFYKELKISAFDPDLATSMGINATVMHYALMVLVAVTTVANFEAVGSILVIAMLIVPAAAAHLLTDRLGMMIAVSLLFAMASAVVGHVAAAFGPGVFGMDGSANTAAMMAVVAGLGLIGAIIFAPENGVVARARNRLSLAVRIIRQDILGLLYRWQEHHGAQHGDMRCQDVLRAVGTGRVTKRALSLLLRRGAVEMERNQQGEKLLRLTPAGLDRAASLVGGHRLWEAYLAKHFQLADDHLHAPAERMEHFISPELHEDLRDQLTDPSHDPHGRRIPPRAKS